MTWLLQALIVPIAANGPAVGREWTGNLSFSGTVWGGNGSELVAAETDIFEGERGIGVGGGGTGEGIRRTVEGNRG